MTLIPENEIRGMVAQLAYFVRRLADEVIAAAPQGHIPRRRVLEARAFAEGAEKRLVQATRTEHGQPAGGTAASDGNVR